MRNIQNRVKIAVLGILEFEEIFPKVKYFGLTTQWIG